MKKFLALVLAGTMLITVPVMAAEETTKAATTAEDVDEGSDGTEEDKKDQGAMSSTASNTKPKKKPREENAAPAPAVEASSVPAAVAQAAAAEGKTVGEYLNNALVTIPGLDNAVPIGQGGHVIINGAPSNQVFTLLKPASVDVSSAKTFAASLGGSVLTVTRVKASVSGFRTAQVNFYMKGIRTGQNIKVFQIVNGRWLEVDVTEIRDDHVVVEMTSLGTLAFIAMPSK
ncbi:MAG: hypothetical protein HDR07_12570 [Lachnospiraceae bacterium]|nr:hypothetical protein [Lachnospiraceae bacterium]